jgi:hypothetical protein
MNECIVLNAYYEPSAYAVADHDAAVGDDKAGVHVDAEAKPD